MKNIFRYERKFILNNNYSVDKIESFFLKSKFNFMKQYDDRYVNSIYFDDKNLKSIRENLDGVSSKKKMRLRWYGEKNLIVNPNFEIKFKKGYLNTKKIFSLKKFSVIFSEKNLDFIYLSLLKKFNFLKNLRIVSSTHYKRKYFISKNNKIRATADTEVFYKNLLEFDNFDLCKKDLRPIVEIKYDKTNDNYVRNNLKNLTLRFAKNSKYINSILAN
tara:strand:- start:57 stop:707 length:651 start_codon:yes stop_codon:yes gene_type:complete